MPLFDSSQVKLLITNNTLSTVQIATAQSKTGIFRDHGVSEPEELQLHHNHEKFLFLTMLLLFAQCKMYHW
jgi:hypothetical protein